MADTPRLALASSSPRRRRLLTAAGIGFVLCEPGHENAQGGDFDHGETGEPRALAIERARRKATGAAAVPAGLPVLGVDTVVDLGGEELGKAKDRADAERCLRRLLGRSHFVHTAHCLWRPELGRHWLAVTTAQVVCAAADDAALARYLDSGQWVGKAGAYGIQDPAQDFLALRTGDLDTVVGLHVGTVLDLLREAGCR